MWDTYERGRERKGEREGRKGKREREREREYPQLSTKVCHKTLLNGIVSHFKPFCGILSRGALCKSIPESAVMQETFKGSKNKQKF